jgi:hypothetical protein
MYFDKLDMNAIAGHQNSVFVCFLQPVTSTWLTHESLMRERRQRQYRGNHRKQEAPFDIQNKCRGMRGSMAVK